MFHIVLDLEMCNVPEEKLSKAYTHRHEIIQLGAVLLDEDFQFAGTFNQYVHPQVGAIDEFIYKLTNITSADVEHAPLLEEAMERMRKWIGNREFRIITWSSTDYYQLKYELHDKKISNRWIHAFMERSRWVDYQAKFGRRYKFGRMMGLKQALDLCGLVADGQMHDGLDDAVNTAKIVQVLEHREPTSERKEPKKIMLHDSDIREPLFEYLDITYGKIRILEEKIMGRSRADVVMVAEDAIYGIEIKSDADTYTRLSSQVRDYDRYYDRNIVVVGTTHALHIAEHVPAHWGIITVEEVDGQLDFYALRNPLVNPSVTWEKKLQILWKPELAAIQDHFGMPKYKEKSKAFVIDKIVARVPDWIEEEELQAEFCQCLFERDYTTIEDTLAEYRKGEIQKKIEREQDVAAKMELIGEQLEKRKQFKQRRRKRRR